MSFIFTLQLIPKIYSPIFFYEVELEATILFTSYWQILGASFTYNYLFKWRKNKIQHHLLQWSRTQVAMHLFFSSTPVVLFPVFWGKAPHFNSFSYFIKYMHRLNANITYKLRCFHSGMFFVGLGSFFCCLGGRVLDELGRSFLLLRLPLKFLVLSLFYIYCKYIH